MLENPYIIALYGWFLFNAVTLGLSKDELDDQKKYFNFKIWWRFQWDNVLITFLFIPVVVTFTNDLWRIIIQGWFDKDWAYSDLALLGTVPLTQGIYFLIKKFKK